MKNIFKWVMLGLACCTMIFGSVATILTASVESNQNAVTQVNTVGAALSTVPNTAGTFSTISNRIVGYGLNKDGKIMFSEAVKTGMQTANEWNDKAMAVEGSVETINAKQAVKRLIKMLKIGVEVAEAGSVGTAQTDMYATATKKAEAVAEAKANLASTKDLIARDNIEVFAQTAGTFFFTYMISAGILLVGFVIISRD